MSSNYYLYNTIAIKYNYYIKKVNLVHTSDSFSDALAKIAGNALLLSAKILLISET